MTPIIEDYQLGVGGRGGELKGEHSTITTSDTQHYFNPNGHSHQQPNKNLQIQPNHQQLENVDENQTNDEQNNRFLLEDTKETSIAESATHSVTIDKAKSRSDYGYSNDENVSYQKDVDYTALDKYTDKEKKANLCNQNVSDAAEMAGAMSTCTGDYAIVPRVPEINNCDSTFDKFITTKVKVFSANSEITFITSSNNEEGTLMPHCKRRAGIFSLLNISLIQSSVVIIKPCTLMLNVSQNQDFVAIDCQHTKPFPSQCVSDLEHCGDRQSTGQIFAQCVPNSELYDNPHDSKPFSVQTIPDSDLCVSQQDAKLFPTNSTPGLELCSIQHKSKGLGKQSLMDQAVIINIEGKSPHTMTNPAIDQTSTAVVPIKELVLVTTGSDKVATAIPTIRKKATFGVTIITVITVTLAIREVAKTSRVFHCTSKLAATNPTCRSNSSWTDSGGTPDSGRVSSSGHTIYSRGKSDSGKVGSSDGTSSSGGPADSDRIGFSDDTGYSGGTPDLGGTGYSKGTAYLDRIHFSGQTGYSNGTGNPHMTPDPGGTNNNAEHISNFESRNSQDLYPGGTSNFVDRPDSCSKNSSPSLQRIPYHVGASNPGDTSYHKDTIDPERTTKLHSTVNPEGKHNSGVMVLRHTSYGSAPPNQTNNSSETTDHNTTPAFKLVPAAYSVPSEAQPCAPKDELLKYNDQVVYTPEECYVGINGMVKCDTSKHMPSPTNYYHSKGELAKQCSLVTPRVTNILSTIDQDQLRLIVLNHPHLEVIKSCSGQSVVCLSTKRPSLYSADTLQSSSHLNSDNCSTSESSANTTVCQESGEFGTAERLNCKIKHSSDVASLSGSGTSPSDTILHSIGSSLLHQYQPQHVRPAAIVERFQSLIVPSISSGSGQLYCNDGINGDSIQADRSQHCDPRFMAVAVEATSLCQSLVSQKILPSPKIENNALIVPNSLESSILFTSIQPSKLSGKNDSELCTKQTGGLLDCTGQRNRNDLLKVNAQCVEPSMEPLIKPLLKEPVGESKQQH